MRIDGDGAAGTQSLSLGGPSKKQRANPEDRKRRKLRLPNSDIALPSFFPFGTDISIRYYQSRRHSENVCHRREIAEQLRFLPVLPGSRLIGSLAL